MHLLKTFGFNKFSHWIWIILKSYKISISFIGKLIGYFSCERGMRQGDLVSPLCFCIVEEVLNIPLSSLVIQKKIKLVYGPWGFGVSFHSLFVDDVMVFLQR